MMSLLTIDLFMRRFIIEALVATNFYHVSIGIDSGLRSSFCVLSIRKWECHCRNSYSSHTISTKCIIHWNHLYCCQLCCCPNNSRCSEEESGATSRRKRKRRRRRRILIKCTKRKIVERGS